MKIGVTSSGNNINSKDNQDNFKNSNLCLLLFCLSSTSKFLFTLQHIQNPIQILIHEHNTKEEIFRKIAVVSANYNPLIDAYNT